MMHQTHMHLHRLRADVSRLGEAYPGDSDKDALKNWRDAFDAASADLHRFEKILRAEQALVGQRLQPARPRL